MTIKNIFISRNSIQLLTLRVVKVIFLILAYLNLPIIYENPSVKSSQLTNRKARLVGCLRVHQSIFFKTDFPVLSKLLLGPLFNIAVILYFKTAQFKSFIIITTNKIKRVVIS